MYSLTNDGALEIFFLGVGTAFSHRLGHTNFLIVKGDDHLLVDFGTHGPDRLRSVAGLEPADVQVFFPTHAHADHAGGMEYLTIVNRYVGVLREGKPKLKVVISEELQGPLWRMTLRGGLGFNEPGMDGRDELFEEYYDVIRPVPIAGTRRETWHAEIGGIRLEIFRTHHALGSPSSDGMAFISQGILIDDRIFFSGDSRFDRELIDDYADRAEFLMHDAGIYETPLHASLDQLRTLPREITGKMLLVHYPEGAEEIPVPEFAGWGEAGVPYRF